MPHAFEILDAGAPARPETLVAPDTAEALRQIAHQLRQPLSTIEAIAYYLSMTLPPRESKAIGQLEKMQLLVQEANVILSDAMHYFRAAPPHPVRVDLNDLVADAVSEMQPWEGRPLRLTRGEGPIPVEVDTVQAAHMVRNLLGYFRRIPPEAEPVDLATSATESEAGLTIRLAASDGAAGELESLLDLARPRLGSGSGLAMASVRSIVDANGGRIGAQAQPAGGMLLSVTFPLAA
jgi:signal transduction histidine kinase